MATRIVVGRATRRGVGWQLLAGALLCILPYFIDSIPLLVAVCLGLLVAPFVIRIEL